MVQPDSHCFKKQCHESTIASDGHTEMPMSEPLDRRTFTHTLLAASALAATGQAGVSAADQGKEASEKKPDEKPEKIPPDALYLQLVLQTYPHAKLDEAALEEVQTDIEQQLSRSRTLSKFPLANSDDPAGGFRAFRAGDK